MTNIITPVTQPELYSLVTNYLFDFQMPMTLFNGYLDIAQTEREEARPWVILKALDNSQSVGPGNNFATGIPIAPTNNDFRAWSGDYPVQLVDAQNNPLPLQEVPISMKFAYKDASGKFYCDYAAGMLYICGTLTKSYTVNQFYIKQAPAISYTPDGINYPNTWVFPARFHKLLAIDIALAYKQVDYDIINLQNATQLSGQAVTLWDQMTRWDSNLQASGQLGVDPFGGGGAWNGNSGGGRMGMI
jgi:hypothetical protein